ncbi:hypothetical protein EJ110_NYTH15604 [Nymphaea thermarum]|nr:hypothetical protein EJ110_NYTH15604 [Nymphaea thermarum]
MEKTDLVRLWVAEGFILKEEGVEMEVTAESCLHTLVGRSLIQDAGNEKYTLNDLVHDFALYMREKEYVSTDQLNSGLVSHHAHYVSSVGGGCSSETLRRQEKLRGLMCREVDCLSTFNFVVFRWLRVLDLQWGKFSKLPESIGDMMLLKYINLSGMKFPSLISSSTYSCLRKIDIRDCKFLENIPNLRYLPNLVDLSIFSVNMIKVFDTTCDHV